MKNLLNKKILFIICGGISAYKSLETIRLFKKNGAEIKTILTTSAKEFVTPLSITSLSQGKVYSDLFSVENEAEMDHISLSRWADIIVIAPATANTISKLAQGTTDDLASTVVLASDKDIILAPAMNVRMWEHPTTKTNIKKLKGFGYKYPITSFALLICGLSLIGLPLTNGFISKLYLFQALYTNQMYFSIALVAVSSALAVVYLSLIHI